MKTKSVLSSILARFAAKPRLYRLQCIDRTGEYRGSFPDVIAEGSGAADFWAVSDDQQGDVGSQAVYVTTAWVQPGLPISFNPNPLFVFDPKTAKDVGASARMLPSEVVAYFTAYLAERKFKL